MASENGSFRKIAIGFAAVTEATVYSFMGFAFGYFLDRYIKSTYPWLTVVFTFLGLTVGFYRLYRVYMADEENDKKTAGDKDL